MKSMIRMALLGLFVAAPSVMAKLPFRNAPNRLDGIYIQKVGLSQKEIKAINNGFGMWLQNVGTWRVVSSSTDPDKLITVKVEKINGMNPQNPTCSDPRAMACISSIKDPFQIDGTNASIKIYTKYMKNGVQTDNLNWNDYAFWTNFATSAVGNLLGGWTYQNGGFAESVEGFSGYMMLPMLPACQLNEYLRGIGRATLVCTYDFANNVYYNTTGLPILELRKYRNSDGALIARYSGLNLGFNLRGDLDSRASASTKFYNQDDNSFLELESAKWVLSGSEPITFSKGRITTPNQTPRCYENQNPDVDISFFRAWFRLDPFIGKGEASTIAVQSTPEGDYFVKNVTNECAKFIGYAGAVTP